MNKQLNWLVWTVAAIGGGWAIYLMQTISESPSTKEVLTVGILMLVSMALSARAKEIKGDS